MKASASTQDSIANCAAEALGALGLAGLTVSAVAERAGVSTALIHYHFDTKARLLVAAAAQVAAARRQGRMAALSSARGLGAVDALWDMLAAGAQSGAERAWVELVLHARGDRALSDVLGEGAAAHRAAVVGRLPVLLRELGASPAPAGDELAATLEAMLDGLSLALLSGQPPDGVRASYDAFWLTLLDAGPSRRR